MGRLLELPLFLVAYAHLEPGPSRGWSRGISYPGPRDVREAPLSLRNIKYTRMHHFEKKNLKIFSPAKMLGRAQQCFPGPHCGSRRACLELAVLTFLGLGCF